jgi:DUF917 family protein
MLDRVTVDDVEAIAIGAGILGTGGGGNPYLGSLHLRRALEAAGPQRLIAPADLSDDASLALLGMMGAPTAGIEKLREGTELLRALRLLERHLGHPVDGVVIAEIGGANAIGPIVAGLQAGIPTVDADGMGRAFPELQMSSFLFHGDVPVTPIAMVDAGTSAALIPRARSARWAERLARNLATSMGARAGVASTVMTGAQVKAYAVPHTLSLAHRLGERVLAARRSGEDAPDVIAAGLGGRVLLRGKIVDVLRRTTRGFARGDLTVEGHGPARSRLEIEFQNEFLIARLDGEIVTTVPDLICIVTDEGGDPVSTEVLRYGTRVAVLAVPAAPQLKSATALRVVGPAAFGYRAPFTPLPGDLPTDGNLHDGEPEGRAEPA